MKVVVCRYKENIDWLEELNYECIVYNKNEKESHLFEHNMENYGYDAVVYLTYIIDNYDNLPDHVCFTQATPFDHSPNFIELVNSFDKTKNFLPLGLCYIRDVENILKPTIDYADSVAIDYTLPIKFVSGAQFIVSKELIQLRSVESYKKVLDSIPKAIVSQTNYHIEYLFPTILGFNDELIPINKI